VDLRRPLLAQVLYNSNHAGAPALCRGFRAKASPVLWIEEQGDWPGAGGFVSEGHTSLMRCHARLTRFALLTGFLCAGSHFSFLSAQTGPIVLTQDSEGRQVYVNTSPASPDGRNGGPSAAAFKSRPDAPGQLPGNIQRLVKKTAERFQVDPKLVDAIIRVESEFNSRAVSPKGAMGLMQLIPATAQRFRVADPFDPKQNIRGGVTYLRYLLDRFSGSVPLSLAAYNAGENRVGRSGGVPAIPETLNYVRKVTSFYRANNPGPRGASAAGQAPREEPIYRYVDSYGVPHFTND
jgi:hypothetical protein